MTFDFANIEKDNELWFRAEMNNRQFLALCTKLKNADLENEIINNDYFLNKLSRAAKYNKGEVEMWLKNAWNTEKVLEENIAIIENTGQSFCMQWAFPQAYYSVFGVILAKFKAIGHTEMTHTAVLKKFGSLLEEGKLPDSISLYCNGTDKDLNFYNIDKPENIDSNMAIDVNNEVTVNNHICQFLGATRKLRLKEKAPSMKFFKKDGTRRKNLNKEHWDKVSQSIGNTTILDFLYRKRIKGNYQDIETYNASNFKGELVLNCLCEIIDRINLVNEAYIYKAIGHDDFKNILDGHLRKVNNQTVESRFETIKILHDSL